MNHRQEREKLSVGERRKAGRRISKSTASFINTKRAEEIFDMKGMSTRTEKIALVL